MTPGPKVEWEHDERVVIDGTPYVLMHGTKEDDDELRVFKPRIMLEAYEPVIDEFQGANIVELGLLEGGSAAYLVQRSEPRRFVGIDRTADGGHALQRFVSAQGRDEQVQIHRGVDQADRARLTTIATEAFADGAIDLVIDDASHVYDPTVASFEVLFPMVRPGGLYIIEDWTSEDWLAQTFDALIAHREPMARAIADTWLAEIADDDGNVAWLSFQRWLVAALTDQSLPHHELALEWRESLRSPLASASAKVLDARVQQLDLDLDPFRAPTLATLGLQLLLAVKGLCPAISSVTVTPWWIAVRRGGDIPEPFTVAAISRDRIDAVGSLEHLSRSTT